MGEIIISIPLTKYLKLQNDYLGGEALLTKVHKGKVYMSDTTPYMNQDDSSDYDFEDLPILIHKPFSKHIDLKEGETKPVKQVIRDIKKKEKHI